MLTKKRLRMISEERRLARIEVPDEILISMMQEGFEAKIKTIEGIPEKAVFINTVNDPVLGVTWFFFESPAFSIVPMGREIPIIPWRIQHD